MLAKHPQIQLAILFGSMATGAAHPASDVDLVVAADRPLSADQEIQTMTDLATAIGGPVDLIDLDRIGEPVLGPILKHGKRLLGSDERHARLINRHLLEEADFLPHYRRLLTERRQAWIGR